MRDMTIHFSLTDKTTKYEQTVIKGDNIAIGTNKGFI